MRSASDIQMTAVAYTSDFKSACIAKIWDPDRMFIYTADQIKSGGNINYAAGDFAVDVAYFQFSLTSTSIAKSSSVATDSSKSGTLTGQTTSGNTYLEARGTIGGDAVVIVNMRLGTNSAHLYPL